MKWYIGQPVVAIVSHPDGIFKKGQEFAITGIKGTDCKCNKIEISIGIKTPSIYLYQECSICGKISPALDFAYFLENRFAPLDTDISELTEILEQKQIL